LWKQENRFQGDWNQGPYGCSLSTQQQHTKGPEAHKKKEEEEEEEVIMISFQG